MKRNILILKASPEENIGDHLKDPYQEELEKLNCNVKVVNTLIFVYVNLDELRKKLENPNDYSGIIFGSPRCVKAVEKAVEKLDSAWKLLPIFAVGETTGRLAHDCLGLEVKGTNSGHGAELASVILQYNLSLPVLIPCGNLSRDTICKILNNNGVTTENVQVYETVKHPDLEINLSKAVDGFNMDIIIYFSPSGVNATVPLLKNLGVILESINLVSIGPTTEKALQELGYTVGSTAAKPNAESLASAVRSILL